MRIVKTVGNQTVYHIWDSAKQIVADVDGEFYQATCYVRGTSLAATYEYVDAVKSEYVYYLQNAHGDVVNLADDEGNVVKTYKYDAFGVEKNISDSDTNAFRYCGEYFDKETGTIYLRARYYNPSTGRFTQRDSFAGRRDDPLSLNLYAYCRNNPLRYIDPSGHDAVQAAAFMVNNPRPTHKVNSAWDAKAYTDWDNKFKSILNSSVRINNPTDAILYQNLQKKVTSKPTFQPNSAWDAKLYNKQLEMYNAWESLKPKPSVVWPIEDAVKNNDYPYYKRSGERHSGTDFGAAPGTPVFAVTAGEVISVSRKINFNWRGSSGLDTYGMYVFIQTSPDVVMRYAHFSAIHVEEGDYVEAGSLIGAVGNTGKSYGSHLHFEVQKNNRSVNPYDYLPK